MQDRGRYRQRSSRNPSPSFSRTLSRRKCGGIHRCRRLRRQRVGSDSPGHEEDASSGRVGGQQRRCGHETQRFNNVVIVARRYSGRGTRSRSERAFGRPAYAARRHLAGEGAGQVDRAEYALWHLDASTDTREDMKKTEGKDVRWYRRRRSCRWRHADSGVQEQGSSCLPLIMPSKNLSSNVRRAGRRSVLHRL